MLSANSSTFEAEITVVVAGRTLAKVEATAADITTAGGHAHALAWDLAELDVVDERVRAAEELAGGGIDILVNNTGGPPPGGVLGHELEVWETHFRSMVLSVIAISDRVVPGMRERGWGRVITDFETGEWGFDTVKPGVPRSITSSEMPPWPSPPVRTAVVTKSARTPLVMKVLAPLRMKSPLSSFRATDRIPARSAPAPGCAPSSDAA